HRSGLRLEKTGKSRPSWPNGAPRWLSCAYQPVLRIVLKIAWFWSASKEYSHGCVREAFHHSMTRPATTSEASATRAVARASRRSTAVRLSILSRSHGRAGPGRAAHHLRHVCAGRHQGRGG